MIPHHHLRYERAWLLYRDGGIPDECMLLLEREMDDAQNHFTVDEFKTFKRHLPGFREMWDGMSKRAVKHLEKQS